MTLILIAGLYTYIIFSYECLPFGNYYNYSSSSCLISDFEFNDEFVSHLDS